ncbi:MAG TPA: DNA-binding response regulator [Gammaproteobacteria bacterium]|nr:DNA-binding response regulator [Gammaproteobacteria bacterium]
MSDNHPLIISIISDNKLASEVWKNLSLDWEVINYNAIEAFIDRCDASITSTILCEASLLSSEQQFMLLASYTKSKLLILGKGHTTEQQVKMLRLGARGYFDINLALITLPIAVTAIERGEVWVERQIISALIDTFCLIKVGEKREQEQLAKLSPKESEVAELVSIGKSNKSIAYELNITERTVKAHLTSIFSKMKINDRLTLAIIMRKLEK